MKYNVGDRVRIKSLDWYNENKTIHGDIWFDNAVFVGGQSLYCGCELTIRLVTKDSYYVVENDYYWTDEMIECKVEDECPQDFIEEYCKPCGTQRCNRTKEYLNGCPYYNAYMCKKQHNAMKKPKFKVGDILFYRGETSGYLKVEEIREENGEIRYYETSRNLYLIENDSDVFADKVCSVEIEETKSEDKLLDNYEKLTDRAFKGGYEKCKSDIELNGLQLPEGYQFVDENGNIINTQKIILEKKPDDKLKLESTKKVREYWSEYARIFIEIYDDDLNECVFTHLWVVDGQRQKGHGKRALIEAETIAKELGCHFAYLKVETNSWMHDWYLRCGYQWYKNADEGYVWLTKNL